jgi:alpha/beta superfamily hydrolase
VPGPAGGLEALLDLPPDDPPRGIALICHPHPQHGGTMHNKVAYMLARSFIGLGVAAMRFNFRGVGASQGSFDDGIGETDDAIAMAAWLRARWPGLPLYLGGFSFGAAVASRAVAAVQPAALVTVALPVSRLDDAITGLELPWLLVHGSEDELIDLDTLIAWLNRRAPGPVLDVVTGADHFFHGHLSELRSGIEQFFEPLVTATAE